MNTITRLWKMPSASPLLALAAYAAVMVLLLAVMVSSVSDVLDQRGDLAGANAMLDQLASRRPSAAAGPAGTAGSPTGSPFLEGATVTVAGAALLQRVAGAVTRRGGDVLSSQVDLNGTQSKAGFISIIASCELDQPALQELLYDLEAGMPFLYVDQLSVQAPASFAASGDGRLRVLLSVSGQWQGTK
ncbi:type II secretion system protein GspM [Bradyrhizobium sp. WD16]|uniref:type II secretion system protein GspM n=1 Tax=Bradyrhizobium sp. WD16 TaxID=1521768 RepID=UPI0020A3EB94|nr:type II secretion system protein GspM [Bradyrhizobium sp. WD16]UTD28132.1 general secretion pathway protein GspM [Bradyrhizobium sp. WD16]